MIAIIVTIAMCAVAIWSVQSFGLPGLAAAMILFAAIGAGLKWVSRKYFDPMAVYEAEQEVIRGHPREK